MTAGPDVAAALRALAATARATGSTRASLARWHEHAPVSLQRPLTDLVRRLRLGADPVRALASLEPCLGPAAGALAAAAGTSVVTGADLAVLAEGLAGAAEGEVARAREAAAASAGARASIRLIAGLAALLVVPAAFGRPDAPGLIAVSLGTGLIVIGIAWVRRLAPAPPGDDDLSRIADLIAAVMRAGLPASAALQVLAHRPEAFAGQLAMARRLVRLGLTWAEALVRCREPGLHALATILDRHRRLGHAIAAELRDLSEYRRGEQDRRFAAATRRAAVAMIVPLATCLLPGFVLVGIVPFLRGISVAA